MKKYIQISIVFMLLPMLGYSQQLDSISLKNSSNWKIFDDSNEVMEPSEETGGVQAIYVENDSNYWVATGGAVHQVINGVWNFHEYEYPETDSVAFNVTDIFKCPFNSHIWFSSMYYGFRMYDGKNWHIISNPELPNFSTVEFIREDKHSNVLIKGWVSGQIYWYILNLTTGKVSNFTETFQTQKSCKTILDSDGLLTTVNQHNILKYKNHRWIEYEFPEGLFFENNAVKRILYQKKQLWILEQPLASNYTKLHQIDKKNLITHIDLPKDLTYVETFEADNSERLWFGTLYGGFFVFDKMNWLNITLENALVGDQGDFTLKLHNGKCWFGGEKGLLIYSTTK